MQFKSNVMPSEAFGTIFYSDPKLLDCRKSVRLQTEMVEGVKLDPEGSSFRLLHVLEIEDRALIYTKSPEVFNQDPRRRDLFHGSVSKMPNRFWREDPTWESSLAVADYSVGSEASSQHPR